MKKFFLIYFLAVCILLLGSSCSESVPSSSYNQEDNNEVTSVVSASIQEEGEARDEKSQLDEPREKVDFTDSIFDNTNAQEIECGYVDLSSVSEGYVAFKLENSARLKLTVTKLAANENTADVMIPYDVYYDGSVTIIPLSLGEGNYKLWLGEYKSGEGSDTTYTRLWSETLEDVSFDDEFEPFIRPSQIVNYSESDECVKLAYELTQYCENDLDIVSTIFNYVINNISYDYNKAETVSSGYLPVPDETLESGTGICFDYAALTASMLRSQGIPCKLVTGYVQEDYYHAWNVIYIEGTGWLTVEIKVTGTTWKRADATFYASGTDVDLMEQDSIYTDRYVY